MLLTKTTAAQWPLQLRMPALESEGSSATPYGVVGTKLLKRHKILPHPQKLQTQHQVEFSPVQEPVRQKLTLDTNLSSSPESFGSHTLKHSVKRLGGPSLPLTPPSHSRQSSAGYASFRSANEEILPPAPSVPGTPPNHQSPPTPDVTPPKAAWRPAALRPLAHERHPSSRADSFKTAKESQTPNQSDEDEFFKLRPLVPSSAPSSQETVHWAPILKPIKPIGLGLGLESDNDGSVTPRPPRDFVSFDGEWGSGTGDISEVEPEWDDNLMRNVTVRKRPVVEAFNTSPCPSGPRVEVYGDDHEIEPSNATKQLRRLSLQEKIVNHRLEIDERMKEKTGLRSISPAVVRDSEITLTDARRFSNMSGRSQASTIVEAMVVEAPTPRPNALRRTKKRIALRDVRVGTPEPSLRQQDRSPLEVPHRLVHKNSRIPDRRQPSLGSTGTGRTVSTTSSSGKSRKEVLRSGGIPVVIVPSRTSSKPPKTPSLRSTSSRHTKSRSVSATSTAPISSSAKTNETGYFDLNPRRRSVSDSTESKLMNDEIRTFDIEPIIPTRTSSLSATTSRNNSTSNSRSGSLTAESLRAHNESMAPLFPPKPFIHLQKQTRDLPQTSNDLAASPVVDQSQAVRSKSLERNGDPIFGNRLSAHNTPFSQISYGTSGTAAEVSEAFAVSLFQHRNDSVLMVQQQAMNHVNPRPKQVNGHKLPREQQTLSPVEEKVGRPEMRVNDEPTTGPVTPPQPSEPFSMDDVDSPLRNPRQAPQPPQNQLPDIKLLPPTPASTEDERQLGHSLELPPEPMPPLDEMEEKPKRGLGLVRRALSKRRYSEGFLVGLGRRFSTKERNDVYDETPPGSSRSNVDVDPLYPAADIPSDASRLHPFWRPARFWDDHDRYSEDEDEGPHEYGRVLYEHGTYPSVDTRPAMPKRKFSLKRTFAILPIRDADHLGYVNGNETDRRTVKRSPSGNMRVVKKTASNSSLRRSASELVYSPKTAKPKERAGRPATSDGLGAEGGGRIHTIPGIGIRFEYVGFRGLQARLRERNNKRLKSRISSPKGAWHGEDEVLGNGNRVPPEVIRNGHGYVVVTRNRQGKGKEPESSVDGNGGLGEQI